MWLLGALLPCDLRMVQQLELEWPDRHRRQLGKLEPAFLRLARFLYKREPDDWTDMPAGEPGSLFKDRSFKRRFGL